MLSCFIETYLRDQLESLSQSQVKVSVDPVKFLVESAARGVRFASLGDADAGAAGFFDRPEPTGCCQQCGAVRGSLRRVDRHHLALENVRLNLPPQGTAAAAPGGADLLGSDAHCLEDLQAVAQGEGHSFQDSPDDVRPRVPGREAEKDAAGIRVQMRGTLSHEIRQVE